MPSKRASALHRNSLSTSHKSAGDNMLTEDGYMLDYAILPRRKAGQSNAGDRCPVRLTKDVLEKYFGMPLIRASKELVSIIFNHFLLVTCYSLCLLVFRVFVQLQSRKYAGSISQVTVYFGTLSHSERLKKGFLYWAENWEF